MDSSSIRNLIPGYVLGAVAVLSCVVIALTTEYRALLFLLCLLGFAIGWGVGLMFNSITAMSDAKKIGQWVAAGIGGVGLGKLDDIGSSKFVESIIPDTYIQVTAFSIFLVCLIVGILVTAVWCNHQKKLQNLAERAESITKISELLNKLA
ncbi:MAG: hypothetical protein OER43_19015 [Gammaproteobacteria bacterium]|nr:hypothetical protein [Gammaproteobacteria bacterium]